MPKSRKKNKPPAGEEQPISIETIDSGDWVTVDISAAFPSSGTPAEILAQVILGIDHEASVIKSFAEIRFREFGDTVSFENALGLSGQPELTYIDINDDYNKGGLSAIMTIPVDSDGKFEYFVRNHATNARNIIRIIETFTEDDTPELVLDLIPVVASFPDTDFALLTKIQGTLFTDLVLQYDDVTSQSASWRFGNIGFDIASAIIKVYWKPASGAASAAEKVKWELGFGGVNNDEAYDTGFSLHTIEDTFIATSDVHIATGGFGSVIAQFEADDTTKIRIRRDVTVANNLSAKAFLLGATVELFV